MLSSVESGGRSAAGSVFMGNRLRRWKMAGNHVPHPPTPSPRKTAAGRGGEGPSRRHAPSGAPTRSIPRDLPQKTLGEVDRGPVQGNCPCDTPAPRAAVETAAGTAQSPPARNTVHFVYPTCYIGLTTPALESPWHVQASFDTKGT